MSTEFLGTNIWSGLTAEAKRFNGKSFVAVAYFGTGAAKRLPLKKGSILVVDASDKAVKSGQTNPAELIKLRKLGVRIFSMSNLHAKVFVFGGVAFVGSTNVSENSEDVYSEASIRSSQTSVVSGARQFVRTLAVNEIGPQKLEALLRAYKGRKKTGSSAKRGMNKIEPRFDQCFAQL
jgi:Icc-related predicted phosphoesterase